MYLLISRNLFLELVHVIVKVQVQNLPSRLTERDPGNRCSLGLKIICCQNSLSSGNCSLFFLRPLSDWMKPTRIMEGNLLYSRSANLNVNFVSTIPSQKPLE